MSREQFEQIRSILEQARKRAKPRKVDLYEVWCVPQYVLRTGCWWQALPGDFSKWSTVYSYSTRWRESHCFTLWEPSWG